MGKTSIEWTNVSWNPVTGCTKVSQGCKNCYAEGVAKRFWGDRRFTDVQFHPERLEQPLHWRKPRRVFVNSMSDLFHEGLIDAVIDRVFRVMALTQHTYQVLTKRPERMRSYMSEPGLHDRISVIRWPLPNVYLGVSVEDQATAEARIPLLLQTPAVVRFVSCEPLLGQVNLETFLPWKFDSYGDGPRLDWVIVGGESGPGARPMDPSWARSIRDQCQASGVPFFFKQWGGRNKKQAGRMLDGRTWDEMPGAKQ